MRRVAGLLRLDATVTYTSSGYSSPRAARERPAAHIVSLTPAIRTARRLALVWGVHSVHTHEVKHAPDMVDNACQTALREEFARSGDTVVIAAGMPFGAIGNTNLLRIAQI